MRYLLVSLLLSACSYGHYHKDNVDIYSYEFGTDQALAGLHYKSDTAELSIDGLNREQTKGLEAVVSGAVQGTMKGIKP